jgi:hypothetical protein
MQKDDCKTLTVDPMQYEKYKVFYDGINQAARQLFEDGTKQELDDLLAAGIHFLGPATAKVVFWNVKEKTEDGKE